MVVPWTIDKVGSFLHRVLIVHANALMHCLSSLCYESPSLCFLQWILSTSRLTSLISLPPPQCLFHPEPHRDEQEIAAVEKSMKEGKCVTHVSIT